jgi:hypothetical protein
MSAENLRREIEAQLEKARLLGFLDLDRTQFLEVPDGIFVEIVLNDAGKEQEIRQLLEGLLPPGGDFRIHPIWKIEAIGEPQIAISQSGGIVAARLVCVILRSGSVITEVQVAVTYLAELELKRVLGADPDLKELARAYVENRLQWGGQSYWDPRRYPRLEIAADRALSLYRSLEKTA